MPKKTHVSIGLGICLGVLAVIGLFFAALTLTNWYERVYPPAPREIAIDPAQIRFPEYHQLALRIIEEFTALDPAVQADIRQQLENASTPLSTWLADRNQAGFELLCLGENHNNPTRRFIAEKLLPKLRFDVLMLEAAGDTMATIQRRIAGGVEYYPLLNADITGVIHAATKDNALLGVIGIDETRTQQDNRLERHARQTREDAIYQNFIRYRKANRRHVVLFGGLHCQQSPGWFYARAKAHHHGPHQRYLNARLLVHRHDGPVEAFEHFMTALDLPIFSVVFDSQKLSHPRIRQWFGLLKQRYLDAYQFLIIFRR